MLQKLKKYKILEWL